MADPILDVCGISKSFGSFQAVENVSFQVAPGQVMGFIGPNGAGKTTTMRIISTLDLPDEGDVRIAGHSILDEPRSVRHRLGFMPDAFGAYSSTTVEDYLDFFARAYGLRGKRRLQAVREVMAFTGLEPLMGKLTTALSKGMKQRMCLAKTLLHDPMLLILDEPASGLDPRARVELRELVKALAEMGKGVLISSHILTELSEICDSICVIEAGQLRASGTVKSIVDQMRPHAEIYVSVLGDLEDLRRKLHEIPGIERVRDERSGLIFDFAGGPDELSMLLGDLVRAGLRPIEFAPEQVDLEDVFLSLTEGKLQ
ncbi:MAG: ABC-2 type transport system ATP-binding protein [Planctomycetota bacterium]|jgi:ABC-2 type transport system ATP-binding protein